MINQFMRSVKINADYTLVSICNKKNNESSWITLTLQYYTKCPADAKVSARQRCWQKTDFDMK